MKLLTFRKTLSFFQLNSTVSRGVNTGHALTTSITDSQKKSVNHEEHVLNFFVDLRKVLGRVNQDILMSKLECYGVREIFLCYIRSLLRGTQ